MFLQQTVFSDIMDFTALQKKLNFDSVNFEIKVKTKFSTSKTNNCLSMEVISLKYATKIVILKNLWANFVVFCPRQIFSVR